MGNHLKNLDSFHTKGSFTVGSHSYLFFSLQQLEKNGIASIAGLPITLKILLENLLRREDRRIVRQEDIEALIRWNPAAMPEKEIAFMPARVLLQDFTGVPCVVDLGICRKDLECEARED